jgi:hypothetical protein
MSFADHSISTPWRSVFAGAEGDSTIPFGTPITGAGRADAPVDLTLRLAAHGEPTPHATPLLGGSLGASLFERMNTSRDGAVFGMEDLGDVGMEDGAQAGAGSSASDRWLAGLVDLYVATGEPGAPRALEDLSEFVISAIEFHLANTDEDDGAAQTAVARTLLLLHVLFYDAGQSVAHWPLPVPSLAAADPARNRHCESFAALEECLRPPPPPSVPGSAPHASPRFDAGLCHLRRVLFWLESAGTTPLPVSAASTRTRNASHTPALCTCAWLTRLLHTRYTRA